MSSVPHDADAASRPSATADHVTALLSDGSAKQPELRDALTLLLEGVSRALGVPIALLSREGAEWRFEAESRGNDRESSPRLVVSASQGERGAETELTDDTGSAWTGLV